MPDEKPKNTTNQTQSTDKPKPQQSEKPNPNVSAPKFPKVEKGFGSGKDKVIKK